MSKLTSDDSGWIALITETSSLTFRTTICGESCTNSAMLTRIGWPTNSGRSCMSIFNPKKPSEIAAQPNKPVIIGANSGFRGTATGWSVFMWRRYDCPGAYVKPARVTGRMGISTPFGADLFPVAAEVAKRLECARIPPLSFFEKPPPLKKLLNGPFLP